MPKTRVKADPNVVVLLRAAFVADCGCNHPNTHQAEAQSVAEVLARAGLIIAERDALRVVLDRYESGDTRRDELSDAAVASLHNPTPRGSSDA